MRVGHFEVVAEHLVESHFQRPDARALDFAVLQVGQEILARVGQLVQPVEFTVHAGANHAAHVGEQGWVFAQGRVDAFKQRFAGVQLFGVTAQHAPGSLKRRKHRQIAVGSFRQNTPQHLPDGFDMPERFFQLQQFPRIDAPHGHF